MKYPNCPICKAEEMLRKTIINKTSYWKCWACRRYFDKDLLFVVIEIPKYKKEIYK